MLKMDFAGHRKTLQSLRLTHNTSTDSRDLKQIGNYAP